MSQLAHIEQHHKGECQNESEQNQRHAFCYSTADKFTTCTTEYLLGINSSDAFRNLCKEEVDIVDECYSDDHDCNNDQDDGCCLTSMFNRIG